MPLYSLYPFLSLLSLHTLNGIDIDECASKNETMCSQVCVNSVGSYRCECENGYFLEEDKKTCTVGERGENLFLVGISYSLPSRRDI